MSIIKQLEAKAKAKAIIKSCWTYKHINTAERYIQYYYEKFEDEIGKQELLIYLDKRTRLVS
jgi:hypothetical protein